MTIETTVSKGQEFFSPGQTEGDAGGTLIGSAAASLLLTQPRWTMCAVRTRNFYSQFFAPRVEGLKIEKWERDNKTASAGKKRLSCLGMKRTLNDL